jgi:hypothetical protein
MPLLLPLLPLSVSSSLHDAPLVALPHCEAHAHGEEHLEEYAEEEPEVQGVPTKVGQVAKPADECAKIEGEC